MKIGLLVKFSAEMQSVRADVAALKKNVDTTNFDGDSSTLPLTQMQVTPLQKRLEEARKSFKKEFERLQGEVTMLLRRAERNDRFERPAKRVRQRLPKLPEDVIVRILSHVSVPDIRNSQLVCRTWRHAINKHALELWETRCNALGLFPPEGTDTVLGRGASRTRNRLNSIQKEASKTMGQHRPSLYRRHYMKWAGHICRRCQPTNLCSLQSFCPHPNKFKWINNECFEIRFSTVMTIRSFLRGI